MTVKIWLCEKGGSVDVTNGVCWKCVDGLLNVYNCCDKLIATFNYWLFVELVESEKED